MATSNLVSYNPSIYGWSYGISGTLIAQTFVMPSGYDRIDYIKTYLRRTGTVAGNSTAYIYATSGGLPTGSSLGSATVTASTISTSGAQYTFDFSDIAVTGGARYAIVMAPGGTTSSNYIGWGRDSGASYAGGQGFYKLSGGSWTDWGRDFDFQVWGYVSVVAPTVTTTAASSITSTQAVLAGDVTSAGGGTVSSRGYAISSTTSTPVKNVDRTVTDGSGTGAFSETVASLTPSTRYYSRSWATNEAGTSYGATDIFDTLSTTPTVTSGSASSISTTTATCSGNVTSDGGATVTDRGVVWDTSTGPVTTDNKVSSGTGTGSFNANLTGLSADTLIYWRAFATNSNGTVYGTEYTFTTKDIITNWGQSFDTTSAGTLTKVSLYLKEVLGASSTATVKIYSDDTDVPDTLLATATKTVTGSTYAWYDFTFSQAVDASTTYWVVLVSPYVVGTRHQYWGADSAGTYGLLKYSTDSMSTWSTQSDNATFKAYIQPSLAVDYNTDVSYRKRYL